MTKEANKYVNGVECVCWLIWIIIMCPIKELPEWTENNKYVRRMRPEGFKGPSALASLPDLGTKGSCSGLLELP